MTRNISQRCFPADYPKLIVKTYTLRKLEVGSNTKFVMAEAPSPHTLIILTTLMLSEIELFLQISSKLVIEYLDKGKL